MKSKTKYFGMLLLASVTMGCKEDGPVDAGTSATGTQQTAPAAATAGARTGTIAIDGETWTVVPAIQCGIYPGPVVAISGHAAGNEDIEISIDYDGGDHGLIQASVENPNGSTAWHSRDGSMVVTVDGSSITGSATFTSMAGGTSRSMEGRFEVNCR